MGPGEAGLQLRPCFCSASSFVHLVSLIPFSREHSVNKSLAKEASSCVLLLGNPAADRVGGVWSQSDFQVSFLSELREGALEHSQVCERREVQFCLLEKQ